VVYTWSNTGPNIIIVLAILKSPYHGFLKMTVHMVWNIALRE